jgi:hypothetical protein
MPHTGLIRVCHGALARHRDTDSFDSSREPGSPSSRPTASGLGVPDGPVRKELAEGNPGMLADGRTIYWHELARPFCFVFQTRVKQVKY